MLAHDSQPLGCATAELFARPCEAAVLDNVEQLMHEPATGHLLADLLATAAGVALLVTSRERLNLHAEWVLPLHGLPRDDPAITLFTDRARQGGYAGVLPTPAVATICQLVEGLPLAVELAAGWTPYMTPEQIAEHLQAGLPPLTTRLRDVPDRHRSLEAVFDRSWMLLTETEQAIWMRLAVFRGGFASEAAAVATLETGDTIAASELLQRSLVAYEGRLRSPASARPGPAELIEALVAAAIYTAQQHFAQAATLLGCAEALGDQPQSPIDPFLRVMADQVRKQLDDALGSTELKQALARGRSTSVVACLIPDP